MKSAVRNPQSEIPPQRLPNVCVGDWIQYRYSYGPKGFTQWSQTTRKVMEVMEDGARFVVEGGFTVFAKSVIYHIPMNREARK
jgi:hypothetical protein